MMKKLLILLCLIGATAFVPIEKKYSVSMSIPEWVTYNRNIDRLKSMGGRKGIDADLLLSTIDTINYFQYQEIIPQLQKQIDTASKK